MLGMESWERLSMHSPLWSGLLCSAHGGFVLPTENLPPSLPPWEARWCSERRGGLPPELKNRAPRELWPKGRCCPAAALSSDEQAHPGLSSLPPLPTV